MWLPDDGAGCCVPGWTRTHVLLVTHWHSFTHSANLQLSSKHVLSISVLITFWWIAFDIHNQMDKHTFEIISWLFDTCKISARKCSLITDICKIAIKYVNLSNIWKRETNSHLFAMRNMHCIQIQSQVKILIAIAHTLSILT